MQVKGVGLFVALGLIYSGFAVADDRVAAVVNDEVIPSSEVDAHCRLNVMSMNKEVSEAQKSAICKRTLLRLIDARLQEQYAVGRGIEPKDEVVEQAWTQNADAVKDVPPELVGFAKAELRNELRRQVILQRAVRPRVQVGLAEIDQVIKDMARKRHVEEREISQILLNVSTPADEDKVRAQMEELGKRVAAGEDFDDLARTYGEGEEASAGGRMGWFATGELNPGLENQLDSMKAGEVSGLIRTPAGWHLVKLLNIKRSAPISTEPEDELELLIIGRGREANEDAEKEQKKTLERLAGKLEGREVRAFVEEHADKKWNKSSDLGWVKVSSLQPEIRTVASGLKNGQFSGVVQVADNDVIIYRANSRKVMPAQLEMYRKRVEEHLFNQRVEQESRRLMRELQQRAFVDIRG